MYRQELIQQFVVTAAQMREIEGRVFAAGMPVAALMEKVAGLITRRIQEIYPPKGLAVGILVGPGHNGGDALVVARELHFRGAKVSIYSPFSKCKDLTENHANYAKSLGIVFATKIQTILDNSQVIIDGLFGFGLERIIQDNIAADINQLNDCGKPILSIDLPSGLHTDTGAVLGTAVKANKTFCLGLWKLGLLQDQALDYIGEAELIDFDLPLTDITAVLGNSPNIKRVTREYAIAHLPLPRSPITYKYKEGHLLLICGSRRYAGGAILTALGARASGVGMLSVAVPETLKSLLVAQVPEALIIGCPETETGAISHLPQEIDLNSYNAIVCGPGLTKDATLVVEASLQAEKPLILDADGLNILADLGINFILSQRKHPTILTPHNGEFKRLFPDVLETNNRIDSIKKATEKSGAIVLLKGGRTIIASPTGLVWIIPESTPALARGGSGDVLSGLLGGLIASSVARNLPLEPMVSVAAWWHANAGILRANKRTELGVDAFTLANTLLISLE